MKSKKLGLFLALALVLSGAALFAQDAPKEEESPIKVWGQAFSSFNMGAGAMDKALPASSLGQFFFNLERIQLRMDHKLSKNFSYHVSLDTLPLDPTNVETMKIVARNAYLRTTGGLDDMLKITFDFGLINTVIMANRNKMIDDRWLTSTSYNGNADFLGAKMITLDPTKNGISTTNGDKAADAGAGLSISLMKMIDITFQVTAGEGFQKLADDMFAKNNGKAWYGDIFVEPIKGLYITGFMRYENTLRINPYEPAPMGGPSFTGKDDWYAGAGVGMNMLGIRAGVDFEMGQNVAKALANGTAQAGFGDTYAKNFFALNAWFNWNLNEIAGFPMLILARISYGSLNDQMKVNDTFYYYVGLGWKFNKSVRIALLFESFYYSAAEFAQAYGKLSADGTIDTVFMTDRVMSYTGNSKLMLKAETNF